MSLDDFRAHFISTGIGSNDVFPKEFRLFQNYPNPFNGNSIIKYSIPKSSQVQIKVFDVLGNEIETIVNEEKPIGTYELNWNAANLPSGVYFYRLRAGDYVQTRKMILLK
ncbi:MAG: T9SS type A sorting domain-containing protein [Ignavibacteriales bacterium]|nr:T9SS type A sorting domain-containing protein [Ignavibacteriales bacterium]